MANSASRSRSIIRSVRPMREILVVEPVQQHHGRHAILLPPGTQCSIGASRACTLTVSAQAILPQHCLIVASPNSTILQEFGESTWLNEHPVREPIEIMDGDRLAVGPAEFRIRAAHPEQIETAIPLHDINSQQQDSPDAEAIRVQQSHLERRQSKLTAEAAELDGREQTLQAREHELNSRFDELNNQLSTLEEQDNSKSDAAARELDEQLMKLTTNHAEKAHERDEIAAELQQLTAEKEQQATRQSALQSQQDQLDRKTADVANRELALKHEKNEFKLRTLEIGELRDAYTRDLRSIDGRQQDLSEQQRQLDVQRQQLDDLKRSLSNNGVGGGDNEISAAKLLVDAERLEVERMRSEMERQDADLAERQTAFEKRSPTTNRPRTLVERRSNHAI